jgi:cell division protein FtsI/penicillin-binding protein 2
MRAKFIVRVRIVFAFFIIFAILLVIRMYFVQVAHGESYREEAELQYVASTAPVDERGDIFFTDKNGRLVTAATQQSGWRLAIQPKEIEKEEENRTMELLQSITEIDEDRFNRSVQDKDDPYEEIAFKLDDETANEIRALDLNGVVLSREKWRYYTAGERAAHTLGFVGFQGHDKVGRYGLERYFEDTLAIDKKALYINFFAEIFSNVRAAVSTNDTSTDGDLITSIEPTVQQRLEETLGGIGDKWNAKKLGGIIMDPNTGEIIALGSWPTFDPNQFNTAPDPY